MKLESTQGGELSIEQRLKKVIREVPDFPKPGISFKDVTPIFESPQLSRDIVEALRIEFAPMRIDAVIGLESRGFLIGMALAMALDVPFIMVRKKGKLPRQTIEISYALEYGESTLEMHSDAIRPGQRILIHDDVLATGGTAAAAAQLVQMAGGEIAAFSFLLELSILGGRKTIEPFCSHISIFATY